MSGMGSITVHVPLALRPRPGRKTIVRPAGSGPSSSIATRADPAMVKALARAFRWKRLLDNGRYASISEIATAERIDRGYVGSILRLTLLAPDIVEMILDGRQPEELGLPALLESFPIEWGQQRNWFAAVESPGEATGNGITASQFAARTGRRHQRNRRTSATEACNAVP
jgi:hypothetical protein